MEKFQQEKQNETVRPLGRVLAREVTAAELELVGGGQSIPNSIAWQSDKFGDEHDYVR